MTKLELIQMIGDVITEIDVARGSLLPNDPNRIRLDDLRLLLDDRQRQLSKAVFDENGEKFQEATKKLEEIDSQIEGSIKKLEDMEASFKNIQRFLDAVTTTLTAIAPFA